ncbi:MAG: hypothetical protein EP330_05920 [Deltaproteobacteria bacterium]|nr:MAG: hypothetical protein EP330_05920 [Deltaproteobacteria bacterium]
MRLLPLLALFACGPEYELAEVTPEGAAIAAAEDATARVRSERFEIGGRAETPLVDYLFVVDNSVSMRAILPKLRAGFSALVESPEAFGKRARIGVITTLPADPEFPGALHPAVASREGLEFDPGFGGLVTQRRIADYKQLLPQRHKHRFGLRGCEDGWFTPDEKSRTGVYCLEAHTQVGLQGTGVEAGLTAFAQLLDTEDFAFREGAAVNVIFVSDTHDPGVRPDRDAFTRALVDERPEVEALRDTVFKRYGASAFRIHAIAPHSVCTGEDWTAIGPVYSEAAAATGGVDIDICTAEDYRPLLDAIATSGVVATRPMIPLERPPAEILDVHVDGEPMPYRVEGRRIELEKMPEQLREVEVLYRFE